MSENAQQREPDQHVGDAAPDVLLDIPKVSVDSIRLAVDGLEADLSLRARVANLLQVDAGVRVHLNGGELTVNGVNAEAELRVRLEQLTRILGRALDTLDNNPHIIEALARTAVDDADRSTQQLTANAAELKASRRSNGGPEGRGPAGLRPRPEGREPAGLRSEGREPVGQRLEGRRAEGREPGAGAPGGSRPEGRRPEGSQRPEGLRQPEEERPGGTGDGEHSAGAATNVRHPQGSAGSAGGGNRNQPGRSGAPGASPPGGGDSGLPGPAQAAAQSAAQGAAQLAEQAGETLRQAGRSVWEAIQGSVAQHRQQGRRDH
ncbi:hypothetical protein ACWER9_14520 [Micromonospora sp. NPDC003944]